MVSRQAHNLKVARSSRAPASRADRVQVEKAGGANALAPRALGVEITCKAILAGAVGTLTSIPVESTGAIKSAAAKAVRQSR